MNQSITPIKTSSYSIIVKVFGRRVGHQTLKTKLLALWKPIEDLLLIDLGCDFYLIKLQNEENMFKAVHNGPWFILNYFLAVQKRKPKFIASNTQLTYTSIWFRLLELPTEFYDFEIRQLIGEKIGSMVKMDTCTSTTTSGRYARICIEVPIEIPLKTHIYIGTHRQ